MGEELFACDDVGWSRIDQPRLAPALPPVGARRWCFFVSEAVHTPDGYVPTVVFENEPGYHRLTSDRTSTRRRGRGATT